MRVLFLSIYDPLDVGAGPMSHLRGLSQSLNKLGCEVHILVLSPENSNRVLNGVQMHYVNPPFRIPLAKGFISSLSSFREVDRLCREFKIDIVHGQSPSSYGYGLLRRSNIPFVVTVHSTSLGEITSYFDASLSDINSHLIYDAMFVQTLSAFLTYIEYKRADKVIAVSKATAEETVRFYRLPKERVVVIHNGVELPSSTYLQVQEGNEEHTILFVARFAWRKGHKHLIDAMPNVLSDYPDAKLLLVGDGYQRTPLQQHVKKLGIENSVLFLGKVPTETLYSLYHEADVYVQPSLYEPFAITIVEAMSMGKPIVATCVGGVPELVTNGVEGLLVEPGNSLQLARAITTIFSDSSLRRKFGYNARKKVEREFTWEAIAKKTLDLYTNLLTDR